MQDSFVSDARGHPPIDMDVQMGTRLPISESDTGMELFNKQYYDYSSGPSMAIKEKEVTSKKKEMKKQLKLMKGLSGFSDMGFCLNLDNGLDEQVIEKMISEATEVLVRQLQKLKAEKMELKRRKKEEKAKK